MRDFILKILLTILVFPLLTALSFANNSAVESLMNKGNNYYQQKQYDKAISAYQNIISQGYEGTAVYYNLGNSFYREGKVGYAIFYYEKALRLSPGDDDIIHNLAIANAKTVDKIDSVPQFFLVQWWNDLLAVYTISGWKNFAYIFYILFLAAVGVFFFIKRTRFQKYIFYSAAVTLLVLISSVILLTIKYNKEYSTKSGIIIEPVVSVKLSPDPNANDAFIIHEGLKVKVEDKVDNWYKIQLHDGKVGWLPENEIGVI